MRKFLWRTEGQMMSVNQERECKFVGTRCCNTREFPSFDLKDFVAELCRIQYTYHGTILQSAKICLGPQR